MSLPAQSANTNVTRTTLDNGLRVVIIRDELAPVVTIEDNYLVGADETPAGFPGMAHAQEHMTFRGCSGLSADQIAAIYAQLGSDQNAQTQQNVTQYFATVLTKDLDIALRVDAACMADIGDTQEEWAAERGAIEQEVARDLSNPTYKFITRLNKDLFAGTPYEHDALGTKASFDQTTGEMLKKFYRNWYAPNNAILVITGDIDPASTLAKIKQYYGSIPRRTVPARPAIDLQTVSADSFTLDSNLPYVLTFVSFRFPGTDTPDFAAARVLSDVLSSQRANLYALVPQGKALGTEFALLETYPKASAAFAVAAIPGEVNASALSAEVKKILSDYATKGIPSDLVEAAKKGEIASAEFARNSISNLAALWSQALASEGRQSPEEDVEAIKRVTIDDVNRVAKKYLLEQNAIVATLKPAPSGEAVSGKGFGGTETTTTAPTKPVQLPDWAEAAVKSLGIPQPNLHPADLTLPNGIRLIVQTEKISPTVTLAGSIKQQTQLETPPGKDGVSDVLEGLFSYGTKTLDRLAFQKALDDIAASESAGANFSLKVLKQDFERGVELLADNELHPALPANAFKVVQQQTAQLTAGVLQSPGYRMDRALEHALLPKGDPLLRETTPETVGALNYDDIGSYYQSTFRPDLTTISVIGDVTPEEARAVIEKYFGQWKASGPKPPVVLPPVPANKASAVNVPDPTQVQDSVDLSEQVELNRFNPEYYALQLGNHVLGGGFYATRLYRDVREKAGYVYYIENTLHAGESRATFSITYGCDPQNVSKARALIQQELVAMQKTEVTPAELQQAKAMLLRQMSLREASEDAIGGSLLGYAEIGLPLDEPHRAAERYFKMTAGDVRAAFSKWIDPAGFVQVVRGPAPQ
ncbi:MAG: insulinase family protein [Acidobacteriaceae bacterium]|nr:insulinase family protein [Acidobacteriaceae bacterium]MBV9778758.1 insulinase family protein [Acidobacteriaceae bacterium]